MRLHSELVVDAHSAAPGLFTMALSLVKSVVTGAFESL